MPGDFPVSALLGGDLVGEDRLRRVEVLRLVVVPLRDVVLLRIEDARLAPHLQQHLRLDGREVLGLARLRVHLREHAGGRRVVVLRELRHPLSC
jgi:hypothetical protein